MPLSRPYKIGLDERLKDPEYAAAYLNAAEEEGVFLLALRDVAEVHKISKVAEAAGLNRESLYRTLSEEGNPTRETQNNILSVLGLKPAYVPIGQKVSPTEPSSSNIRRYSTRSYRTRGKTGGRRYTAANQLLLSFPDQDTSVYRMGNPLAENPTFGYVGADNFGIGKVQPTLVVVKVHSMVLPQEQQEQAPTVPAELLRALSTGATVSAYAWKGI